MIAIDPIAWVALSCYALAAVDIGATAELTNAAKQPCNEISLEYARTKRLEPVPVHIN